MQPNLLSTNDTWREAWNRNWARPDLQRVRVAVAYCSHNGAENIVERWENNRVPINFLVGLNDGVTDVLAREKLWKWSQNTEVEVRGTFKKSGRFHPKIYVFERAEEVRVMLGSVNLTHSAFHQNCEAALELVLNPDETLWHNLRKQLDDWELNAQTLPRPGDCPISSGDVSERLLELMREGVLVEVEVQVAPLRVFFKKDVFDIGDARRKESGSVTIERLNLSHLRLVSQKCYKDIERIGRRLHKELHQIAIKIREGWFVPRPAYGAWKQALQNAQNELKLSLLPFETAEGRQRERDIWLEELPRQIYETWTNFHGLDKPLEEKRVRMIMEMAKDQFDKKAQTFPQKVTFLVAHAPHSFPTMLNYSQSPSELESDLYQLAVARKDFELRNLMLAIIKESREEVIFRVTGILNPESKSNHKQKLIERLDQLRHVNDSWFFSAVDSITSLESVPADYKRMREQAIEHLRQSQNWEDETVSMEQVLAEFSDLVGWRE